MKKFFAGLIKFLTVLGVVATLAYAVVRYWDGIMEFVDRIKSLCAEKCPCRRTREQDDYADWDAGE